MLSKEVLSIIFKSLVWLDQGLNPGLPEHWRTLNQLDQWSIEPYNNQQNCGLCCSGWSQSKIESEKEDKYLGLAWELKKLWNMKVTFIQIVIGALGTVSKGLIKGLRNKRTSGDHPNYYIIEIGQSTEKNPGDLRKLAVTQTPEPLYIT